MNSRGQRISIGLIAAASLLLETSLTRLFAVSQYYHFAFLVVSLALLGYGASGSILVLAKKFPTFNKISIQKHLRYASLGFVVCVGVAYGIVNTIPFDSYAIAWDKSQFFYLGLFYVALSLPFMMSGYAVGIAIDINQENRHKIYGINLVGSGLGALVAPVVLKLAGVPGAVLLSGVLGLLAIISLPYQLPGENLLKGLKRGFVIFLIIMGISVFCIFSARNMDSKAVLGMTLSSYKGLAQAMRRADTESIFSAWNALSKIDVIKSPAIHSLPGLSYVYSDDIPDQLGLSVDAESPQPVTLISPETFTLSHFLPEAVAFKLIPEAKTLIVEPGGGLGVLQALSGGASEVIVIQENPLIEEAIQSTASDFNVFVQPKVRMRFEANRIFMAQNENQYDLIFYPLAETYRPVTSGAFSLTEEFDLTVEGLRAMIENLTGEGIFITTRWIQLPPSDSLRLAATLVKAVEDNGKKYADEGLVMYRGIQTMTILYKPSGWGIAELGMIRAFCDEMRFDLVWLPDIDEAEVNKYNKLQEPAYYQQIKQLIIADNKTEVLDSYPYAITPLTDDGPFFYHFFRWEQTPDVLGSIGHTMLPFGGSGYLVLLFLLFIVGVISSALILLPLLISSIKKEYPGTVREGLDRWKVLGYFSVLGLAFLFIEIPIIQRSILLFGNATYAFTIIICVILVFSGLGSLISQSEIFPPKKMMAALIVMSLVISLSMPQLVELSLKFSTPLRILTIVIFLAPMAVLMGMPFPYGLDLIQRADTTIIPWVWAVNGSVSVVASVLAAILILSFGFTWVQFTGGLLYGIAFCSYLGLERQLSGLHNNDGQ